MTTPALLRLASIALVGLLVALWVAGAYVLNRRWGAAREVALTDGPLLLDAEELYVALADADATASRAFLDAGQEPGNVRHRYLDDLERAADRLAAIGSRVDAGSPSHEAAQTIGAQLSVYAGAIEAARAENRQGLPVGAARLRQASTLMRTEILPDATTIYSDAARRLDRAYRAGTRPTHIAVVTVTAVFTVGALLVAQLFVALRSRRILNPALVLATVLAAGAVGWALAHVASSHDRLVDAQHEGSDDMLVRSTARILSLRAQSASTLALIERGTGDEYLAEFDRVTSILGDDTGRGGLIEEAVGAGRATAAYGDLLASHRGVQRLLGDGSYEDAVVAFREQAGSAERLDDALGAGLDRARRGFTTASTDARSGFALPAVALSALALAAVVLVVAGLHQRIREYR